MAQIKSELLEKAINKFGNEAQIDKLQEELQELALALHQYKCVTKNKAECLKNIYSELADVKIMMAQAEILFNKNTINEMVDFKLNRLEKFLNK